MSTRDIELFTELKGDRNPLHYDAELAAGSRFGVDRPISRLRTTIANQDGTVVLEGTALVYTEPLG